MPKPGKQSTHPIYPRPVSPLHYEPLHTRPEDVLWEPGSGEDKSDSDEGVRAAKRRRIEKFGEAYLRGDGLFILSAGIKGPLGKGWLNPWREKKRTKGLRGGKGLQTGRMGEVPETIEKGRTANGGKWVKQKCLKEETSVADEAINNMQGERCMQAGKQILNFKRSPIHDDPFTSNNKTLDGGKSSEKPDRKEWLRKNNDLSMSNRDIHAEDVREQQSSPSSRNRQPRPAESSASAQAEGDWPPRPRPGVPESSDGRAESLIKLLRGREDPTKPLTTTRPENLLAVERSKLPETTPLEAQPVVSAQRLPSLKLIVPKDGAEEVATTKMRSPAPQIFEPKLPSPPAEGSLSRQNNAQDQDHLEWADPAIRGPQADDQHGSRESPPPESPEDHPRTSLRQEIQMSGPTETHQAHRTMPPPTFSTETSSTTIVSIMPSAQLAPAIQLPPPNESLPSTGDKLSEQIHDQNYHDEEDSSYLSTQAAIAAANLQLHKDLTTPHAPPHVPLAAVLRTYINSSASIPKSKSGITPFSAFSKPNQNHTTKAHHSASLNTQEMLDAVTPFNLTTTIKKIPLSILLPDSESPSTSAAAQKPIKKKPKVRKRASFAHPDDAASTGHNSRSSQGSIKASLKVRKPPLTTSATEKTERGEEKGGSTSASVYASEFGKLGLDMETSFEDENEDEELTTTARDGQDMTATSGPTATSSSRLTTGQDAQKVKITPEPATRRFSRVADEDSENDFQLAMGRHESVSRASDSFGLDAEAECEGEGDDFDLSAAMDEVGSFLQSWDTDREVRDMQMQKTQSRNRKKAQARGVVNREVRSSN
jgi:hypothetical protein